MDSVYEGANGTLFILGNGFDLDLGLKTGYHDFCISDCFPFVKGDTNEHDLGRFIREAVIHKWFDLEDELASFGEQSTYYRWNDYSGNIKDYDRLVKGLSKYLNSIDLSRINKDSVAARLLRAADDPLVPTRVFSFNYTDFSSEAEYLGLRQSYGSPVYVHGSLKENNVVLGVGDYMKLPPGYTILHKTSSEKYSATDLMTALSTHDIIIIFGQSLSKVDYPYFEGFFKDVTSGRFTGERKKYIRVFTYDENSRMSILDNLREMNGGLIKLYGLSDFRIICTKDNMDSDLVDEVLSHIAQRWHVVKHV